MFDHMDSRHHMGASYASIGDPDGGWGMGHSSEMGRSEQNGAVVKTADIMYEKYPRLSKSVVNAFCIVSTGTISTL